MHRKEDLDQKVAYRAFICTKEKHTCTKKEYKGELIPIALEAPSKIFLEAFHEFSLLWHNLKPGKDCKLCTDKTVKKRGPHGSHAYGARNIKRYLKASQHQNYTFLYISFEDQDDLSYKGVELVVLHGRQEEPKKERILKIGTQYKTTYLKEILKNIDDKHKRIL